MHVLGLIKMFLFFGAWLFGCAVFPLVLISAYYKIYAPLYLLLGYYILSIIFPPRRSDYIRELLGITSTPYFKVQKVIFDEGAEAPEPKSKTMLCVGPHGILAVGWCYMNTCVEFIKADITWLIAPILLQLPLCRDFMHWGNSAACTPPVFKKLMGKEENIALLPGGFQEATLYKRGKYRLYLNERKGFIKVVRYIYK